MNLRRYLIRLALPLLESVRRGSFSAEMADLIAAKRRATIASPVLDTWRYPYARAEAFDPRTAARILWFIRSNAERFDRVASMLSDDASRELLKLLFAYRALGPRHVTLPKGGVEHEEQLRRAAVLETGPGDEEFPPFPFLRFEVPTEEGPIRVECWLGNIAMTFFERQYDFRRGGVTIAAAPGNVVIDAGACFGDTALSFASAVGASGRVYAFEPMPRQREIVARNLARNPALAQRVRVFPFAVSDEAGRTLMFPADGGAGARPSANGKVPVKTTSIDAFAEAQSLERVDFIKMDIEGAEAGALEGARETIRKHRPELAISLYHRLTDFLEIPTRIKEMVPQYRLYLGHHTVHAEETVLYATAAES